MAERENEQQYKENKGRQVWRLYKSEVLAALIIVVLVIAAGFWVNKFFYGFDLPEFSFADPVIRKESSGNAAGRFKQSEDWRLLLVNKDHPMEEEFDGELTDLRYGQSVDSRIYPNLQDMFDEMRANGLSPRVVQGYRTSSEQESRLKNKISEYMGYGKSKEEAEKLALQWEAAPGTSEHELGICVDISSETGENASANEVWNWMDENCWKYGFIKRYPNNKSQITGVRGEPWHYRYVGAEAAEEIMKKGITLEEYLGAVPVK
jgi:D-alanyl-D-alanine carboxypeptidase